MKALSHIRHKIGPSAFRLMYIKLARGRAYLLQKEMTVREVI